MKHIKARIAAVLCAAAAALFAVPAAPAGAYSYAHQRWLTPQTQDMTEYQMNFSHSYAAIWNYYHNNHIYEYTGTVKSGIVLGPGYATNNISGVHKGETLSGSAAWARFLANKFFGLQGNNQGDPQTAYMEQYPGSINSFRRGDQIVLSTGGTKRTVFVTSVSDNSIYCTELWGSTIAWDMEFTRSGNKLTRTYGGVQFNIDYVIRPIREGDANGDSIVDFYDFVWIAERLGQDQFPGKNRDILLAAVDFNGSWMLDESDAYAILNHGNGLIMNGDYRYVTEYQWQ